MKHLCLVGLLAVSVSSFCSEIHQEEKPNFSVKCKNQSICYFLGDQEISEEEILPEDTTTTQFEFDEDLDQKKASINKVTLSQAKSLDNDSYDLHIVVHAYNKFICGSKIVKRRNNSWDFSNPLKFASKIVLSGGTSSEMNSNSTSHLSSRETSPLTINGNFSSSESIQEIGWVPGGKKDEVHIKNDELFIPSITHLQGSPHIHRVASVKLSERYFKQ
ncbi:hypothetical protein EBU24_06195, partial [bacterium]|nr:hypothetical protein [bacterium]